MQQFVDHLNFVQGVSWDPVGKFIVSQSSDRTCRVYQPTKQKRKDKLNYFCSHVLKFREYQTNAAELSNSLNPSEPPPNADLSSPLNLQNIQENPADPKKISEGESVQKDSSRHRLFLGDTLNSFFRRCGWSPDGSIFIAPSGVFRSSPSSPASADVFTSYVWFRSSSTKFTKFT